VDGRLRDSERRAALGDESARSTLLRQRVRAGALTLSDLELAAYLGDAAAADAAEAPTVEREFDEWIRGLGRWGPTTQVRAGVALGRALLEERKVLPGAPEAGIVEALGEAEAWCDDPTRPVWRVHERAQATAVLSSAGLDQSLAWLAAELIAGANSTPLSETADHVVEACRFARRLFSEATARRVVREALLPDTVDS
jgi:hypothetical protein